MSSETKRSALMPFAKVGFIGAGQLARMSIPPAIALGIELHMLATGFEESAARANVMTHLGSPSSQDDISLLAGTCDVTTFDHELVDVEIVAELEGEGMLFAPGASVLQVSQSKRLQREIFESLDLRVPDFFVGKEAWSIDDIEARLSYPLIAKADRGGYDGRGVWAASSREELEAILHSLGQAGLEPVIEERVDINREMAIIVARSRTGEIRSYPLVETIQVDGMLAELVAPAAGSDSVKAEAERIALKIAERLDVVGLLAVELFDSRGELIVNEIATRPHNSGHYSIEGCVTSQFEQHLRAVLGWPLGSTELISPFSVTVNLIGGGAPVTQEAFVESLASSAVHLHWYDKAWRPGRKLGHVTVLGDDRDETLAIARQAVTRMCGSGGRT